MALLGGEHVHTCSRVLDDEQPIGYVIRDDNGDWEFLCAEEHSHDDTSHRLICAEHLFEREPDLVRLGGLRVGFTAFRLEDRTWLVSPSDETTQGDVSVLDLSKPTECLCCDAEHAERDADGYDLAERTVLAHIRDTGLHIWQIEASAADDGFSYSVGLSKTVGCPDIIVFGQKKSWQGALINLIAERARDGEPFKDGSRASGLIPNYECVFRVVKSAESYQGCLGWWMWYYSVVAKIDPPLVLQAVWPDMNAKFPWDDGYSGAYRQPLLP